jgi:hypothetical protein
VYEHVRQYTHVHYITYLPKHTYTHTHTHLYSASSCFRKYRHRMSPQPAFAYCASLCVCVCAGDSILFDSAAPAVKRTFAVSFTCTPSMGVCVTRCSSNFFCKATSSLSNSCVRAVDASRSFSKVLIAACASVRSVSPACKASCSSVLSWCAVASAERRAAFWSASWFGQQRMCG